MPWYLILGNHDYESHPEVQINYTTNIIENNDKLWNLPSPYYHETFEALNLDLFGIDTNCVQDYVVKLKPSIENSLNTQREWLQKVVIGSTIT